MLTEEAHHMFVGETGVLRVVERTAQQMAEHKKETLDDVRKLGVVDLPTMQKYLNLWYTLSLDLFGGEISSNAASFFASGLKGRAKEEQFEDHLALTGTYGMDVVKDGKLQHEDVPLRNAMNEVLRDAYVDDCQRGVDRWNKTLEAAGLSFRFTLPSRRFHRAQGVFAGLHFDALGNPISAEEWARRRAEWLPNEADRTYVKSLQQRAVTSPGEMAHWIAPPAKGINGLPLDYQYVRTDQ
jgi:benzoyl-CoA 2,3-dioxygenase component B